MIRKATRAALACTLCASFLAIGAQPALEELDEILVTVKAAVPVEDFVEFPKYDRAIVSPDGTKLAVSWIDEKRQRGLSVTELPSMKPVTAFPLSASLSNGDMEWANDRRLIFQPKYTLKGFRRLTETLGAIITSDIDNGNQRFVNEESLRVPDPLPPLRRENESLAAADPVDGIPGAGNMPGRTAQGPVRVLRTRFTDPDLTLVQTTRSHDRRGNGEGYGAFLLNVRDSKLTRVASLPFSGGQFVIGPGDKVALAVGVNSRNQEVVYYLPKAVRDGGKDWKLVSSSASGRRGLRPVAWTGNGEEYYALDGRGTTRAVVIWNAEDDTQKLLYRHAAADMEQVWVDPAGMAWMFQGNDHYPVYWYPDPNHPLARLHRTVSKKAENEQVEVVSASDDMTIAVIQVSSGRRPPVYMVVDVEFASSIAGLFNYPTLRGNRLARVDAIEFRARDGLVIRGYITNPEDTNGQPRSGLPLVVIAHDGPLGESAHFAYEHERQLFASRGFAVLQINRRGSPGFGATYERAGDGKWGTAIQDDFIDGVRWAIQDGVADPERICFYGTGYGAYSAMVAAAREPDLFKCVIGVSGVYDMPAMLGGGQEPIPPAMAQVLGTDMLELGARSPINLASAIKAQVFLVPQQNDEFYPVDQSNRMRTALSGANNMPQWQIIGQEFDGQHSVVTRANGYDLILKFLQKQVGNPQE